ncbi:cupin domain-containing protein [Lysinibacillus sp. KU-BSD001]|uniref:cupin domain-containing protein n=1 Tax=Lysinibacillus sp. KU-BSD001 TaxID=3141328 RepID=UPI0036E88CD9
MYYAPWMYSYPASPYMSMPMCNCMGQLNYGMTMNGTYPFGFDSSTMERSHMELKDYGPNPFVINIHEATEQNNTYRTALWTGKHLQVTLMSLQPGEDIGLEIHPQLDQFIRIEQGQGITQMGKTREQLKFVRTVQDDDAIIIPAGTWHNLTNTGNIPLKLYSIYAPLQHPFGTVHVTKEDAMRADRHH